jgi:formamidopyrimidine-DNA glycosylase
MGFDNYGTKKVVQPVIEKSSATIESVVQPKDNKGSATKDAKWWREYRKKPKFCPHCKKQI